MSDLSPLSGAERKLDFGAVRSAFDPEDISSLDRRPTITRCLPPDRRSQCEAQTQLDPDP